MTKFLVLYRAPASAMDQMASATPEQVQAGLDAWMAWAGKAGDAVVDLGAPLAPAAIIGDDDAVAVPSGVCGFSVLQAETNVAVTALLDGHPHLHLPGSSIEILEYLAIPGM